MSLEFQFFFKKLFHTGKAFWQRRNYLFGVRKLFQSVRVVVVSVGHDLDVEPAEERGDVRVRPAAQVQALVHVNTGIPPVRWGAPVFAQLTCITFKREYAKKWLWGAPVSSLWSIPKSLWRVARRWSQWGRDDFILVKIWLQNSFLLNLLGSRRWLAFLTHYLFILSW